MTVTNSEFLRHLAAAAPRGSSLWVNGAQGWPASPADSMRFWAGQPWVGSEQLSQLVDGWGDRNAYFSVAALRPDDSGELRRRKSNFVRLLALVVDDADQGGLAGTPSWIVQTSPGKHQIGIFLDRDDDDCADVRLVDALVTRMARDGLLGADKSGNNICRYVRLPVGQNQKSTLAQPFQVDLISCQPAVCLTLDDAAAVFGVDLDQVRAELAVQPQVQTGLVAGEQADKLRVYAHNVMRGENLHDSINEMAASMVASGAHGGAVTNMLRAMMDASVAMRDDRFMERYADIPRAVMTAEAKYKATIATAPVAQLGAAPAARDGLGILEWVNDPEQDLDGTDWLVDGFLETDAVSMVFGPSNVGKSFIVMDIACCVATGKPWHGHQVKQGPVVYVAGEGAKGVQRRLAAWQRQNGRKLGESGNFFRSTKSVPVNGNLDGRLDALIADCEVIAANKGNPALIVIDTLATNFGEGDENSSNDATAFTNTLNERLRQRFGANVLVVHHTGHDKTRARGAYALKANVDIEIQIDTDPQGIKFECTKMKESEKPKPRFLELVSIELGTDHHGRPITSAAVKVAGNPLDFQVGVSQAGSAITAGHVVDAIRGGWVGMQQLSIALDIGEKPLSKIMGDLREQGLVEWFEGKKYRPTAAAIGPISTRGGIVVEKAVAARQAAADAEAQREADYAAQLEGR